MIHQRAASAREIGAPVLQIKWLPVSVIVEHVLPLLDRVSWNRLCSTYKELHASSRKIHPPWPFKRRLKCDGEPAYIIYSLAFSSDSELLASGGLDGAIRIWSRADGRCITHLEGQTHAVRSLCFSPDRKRLASAISADTTFHLWNLQDHQSFTVLEGHASEVMSVAFSRDGSTLVSGDVGGGIRLWDANDGTSIRELVDESIIDCIESVTFAPDGKTIASSGSRVDEEEEEHGAIILWDISDAEDSSGATVVDTYDGAVTSLEYSPDGRYFASGAHNGTVRLWSAADNSCCARVMTSNIDPVFSVLSVAFSPNGKILASASADDRVRLWSVVDGNGSCFLVKLLEHNQGLIFSIAFSPDGETLASGGRDGRVRLWNPHEEDQKRFEQVDWEKVFLLWNFSDDNDDHEKSLS